MKIDGNSPIVNLKGYINEKEGIDGLKDKDHLLKGPSESNFESVELSDRARELAKIKMLTEKAPEVREERVDAIRKKIEEGTYKVDSLDVARKMIREHLIDIIV